MPAVTDPAAVVKRYLEIVADLGSSADDLLAVLHPKLRLTELPNAISPRGAVRDRDATVAGFLAGKALLSAQSIAIGELLVSGDRVVVRATWRGTIANGGERLPAGSRLVAHVSAWLTVTDGLIREHDTYDCYESLPSERGATP